MNVKNVIIVNDFNYIQGGASKVAIDTAILLKKNGINVIFFSAVNKKSEENIEGITYVSTEQNEAIKDSNRLRGFLNGIYNVKARKKLKEVLLKLDNRETVIHVHGWTKALSSSIFDIAFKMKFKVVLTLHDYFLSCPNGGYYDYKLNKICNRKALSLSCIKCNCDSRNYSFKLYRLVRQFVQNKIVKLNKKIKYAIGISDLSINVLKPTLNCDVKIGKIFNPITFENKNVKIDYFKNNYYLYVGRISKEKGVDIFCQAISELNVKGIVVGDGDEKKQLEKKYENIKFVGWKNSNEVNEYMKSAKALIFPSKWYETAGLTILEAQSVGLPVFVSSCCAGKEFIINNDFIFNGVEELKRKIAIFEELNFEYFDLNNFSEQVYMSKLKSFFESD